MPITVKDTSTQFTPPPEGLFQAVCCDVVDLGLVKNTFGEKHKIQITWQLDVVNEETGRRFLAVKRYTASLSEKATLRKDLETWRSRKFTREELEGFDLEVLIGVNAQVQIVHNLGDDGTRYGNVSAVVPLGKGMAKMKPENFVRKQDRDKPAPVENGEAEEPAF